MTVRIWELAQRVIALALIIPAVIIAAPFALLIAVRSPGPPLIRQRREGKDGVQFGMYKLRTMVVDAAAALERYIDENPEVRAEWEAYGRVASDPRIAGPAARFARRFSVDELPQLLNVIRGEMNLVGPRPMPTEIAVRMTREDYLFRRQVLPGMTGLWQVSGRSEMPIEQIGAFDRDYILNRSVRNDLAILARTARAVLGAKGAY